MTVLYVDAVHITGFLNSLPVVPGSLASDDSVVCKCGAHNWLSEWPASSSRLAGRDDGKYET
ncbi:hypothetical protein C3B51_16270 [Pseudoalteromonas rubra]|uniref:Uncharacterized protein n=1 Tax=Pseudoalteromonas rubra TaxID=43658 RepID=A0A4Q7E5P2_9GAMM|nr:hypothetical protein [Pseudoalteromonas rubra]RZM77488.1 hypothetical protein C3B51_16270 [Pseudoalteromonas rubra]